MGLYAQDSWRVSSRVTVNVGARWEPYFGQNVENNAIAIFKMENFQQGDQEPGVPQRAGRLDLSGRRGFPPGQTGLEVSGGTWRRGWAWRGTSMAMAAWPCGRPIDGV
jgi:hypothetical protein